MILVNNLSDSLDTLPLSIENSICLLAVYISDYSTSFLKGVI